MINKKYTVTVLRKKFSFEEPKPIEVQMELKNGWLDADNERFQLGDIVIDTEHEKFHIVLQTINSEGEPMKYFFKIENDTVVLSDTHDPRDQMRYDDDSAVLLNTDRIEYFSDMSDTIEEFGGHIFHHTNCPVEIDPDVQRPYHGRSLSVGDAVTKDGKIAICASCGWTVYDSKDLGTRIMELAK
jgi:hypothetical protein